MRGDSRAIVSRCRVPVALIPSHVSLHRVIRKKESKKI